MSALDNDMQRSLSCAGTAQRLHDAAMMEFQAYCTARNWTAAEDARAKAIAHMESYLDHISAMHKRLESADAKR